MIAFVCACAGVCAGPLSLLGIAGTWCALVFFLIVETLALIFAWQARAQILGTITIVLVVLLMLLVVGNTIRFIAS